MTGRGGVFRLLGARPNATLAHPLGGLVHHGEGLKALLILNVFVNLTDLTTSYVALQAGLTEGNPLALGISTALGLNILESLALMKAVFIGVAAIVALMGMRTTNRGIGNMMLGFLLTSTLIFSVVSLSNIGWIVG